MPWCVVLGFDAASAERVGWVPLAPEAARSHLGACRRVALASLPPGTRIAVGFFRFLVHVVFGDTRTMDTYLIHLGNRFGEEVAPR